MRRKIAAAFVLVAEDDPQQILGYFTLAAYGVPLANIPSEVRRRLPRYDQVSATLIGRLAIDSGLQGQGLGSILLARALRKAYQSADHVGSCMVVVDALDAAAVRFYEKFDFVRLPDSMRLILPMWLIGQLIDGVEGA